ncbi:hypothetical protein Bca52824_091277 [Brassica carinata]|uniref:Uncharacterized protein n=1 Tax=Brassica carinata TaxID=52824 RepID=A0A8X7NX71_BRACI|nr:hypothetical protein Bca52824_091277 [Brassica carinata]
MEWRECYLDVILVPPGLMVYAAYHVYLWYKLRTQPLTTIIGTNARARRFWVASIIKDNEKKNILAVQTLRNCIMGSTLMATTSILLCAGLAAVISSTYAVKKPLNDAVYGAHGEFMVALKYVTILTIFLFSFFSHSLSIRFINQVNILINTPFPQEDLDEEMMVTPEEYVAELLERGFVLNTVGNRLFYAALPLMLWIFGPVLVFLCSVMMLVALLLLAFVFTTTVFSDDEPETFDAAGSDGSSKIQLNAKIHALESQIDEKAREVKGKDELVAEKEKLLKEKEDKIASLQKEVSSLQGSSDSAKRLGKVQARVVELEKQVEVLRNFLEQKNKEKTSTEALTKEAEKKLTELNSSLDKLEKTNEEQMKKIGKLERAIKIAEAYTETHWEAHGKPAVDTVILKVTEAKTQAVKWAEPHVKNAKTKYIPAIKGTVATHVEPHVRTLSIKAKEAYHASKSAVSPHIVTVQEIVDPYYQEAKKFSKPYVDQVVTATKPHVDNVKVSMKPYTTKVIIVYTEFLESATTYHNQVQAHVEQRLKSHELTEAFATNEFVWFAASALWALPIFFAYRVLSSLFCTNTKKLVTHPHHHGRRKTKRSHHTDK